ncbi:MAG TPA: PadR family transcriptional regulator [Phycisphaerales bacterium]|nr:PadR family transcriptional regulator [Phycisphaerales bacterium]
MNESAPNPALENGHLAESIADKAQRDLGVGTAWLVVLATIARASSPVHGYEIARSLSSANPHGGGGGLGVKHGTLYPILRTMEAEGLVTSTLVPSTQGPARRCFTITPAGRDTLGAWTTSWRTTRAHVDELLGGLP